jgi:hypothetical protein
MLTARLQRSPELHPLDRIDLQYSHSRSASGRQPHNHYALHRKMFMPDVAPWMK